METYTFRIYANNTSINISVFELSEEKARWKAQIAFHKMFKDTIIQKIEKYENKSLEK